MQFFMLRPPGRLFSECVPSNNSQNNHHGNNSKDEAFLPVWKIGMKGQKQEGWQEYEQVFFFTLRKKSKKTKVPQLGAKGSLESGSHT
jgi:hypothetical protein